jgi:acyl carrier protein
MNAQRKEIFDFIVNDIFLNRLELEDDGFSPDDFDENTQILNDSGLGLDSVDVLDLLVGVEKKYGFKPVEIDSAYIDETCESISTVIDMVQSRALKAA